jgi:hypothetical protein
MTYQTFKVNIYLVNKFHQYSNHVVICLYKLDQEMSRLLVLLLPYRYIVFMIDKQTLIQSV